MTRTAMFVIGGALASLGYIYGTSTNIHHSLIGGGLIVVGLALIVASLLPEEWWPQ